MMFLEENTARKVEILKKYRVSAKFIILISEIGHAAYVGLTNDNAKPVKSTMDLDQIE